MNIGIVIIVVLFIVVIFVGFLVIRESPNVDSADWLADDI